MENFAENVLEKNSEKVKQSPPKCSRMLPVQRRTYAKNLMKIRSLAFL